MLQLIKSWFAFCVLPMYFGGGGGSSASDTTTQNTDRRISLQSGAATSGDNNVVNTSDLGAIDAAFDFAKNADATGSKNYSALLSTTSGALKDLIGAQNSGLAGLLSGVASTQNFIASTQAQQSGSMDNRSKLILGLGAMGVLGLFAWGKK